MSSRIIRRGGGYFRSKLGSHSQRITRLCGTSSHMKSEIIHPEPQTGEDRPFIPLYETHVYTTAVQKTVLALGSSIIALTDPYRADMVAVSGETLGQRALQNMYEKMKDSREGRALLKDRPTINSSTVDFDYLKSLPEHSLGHTYASFCEKQKITPDSRDPVQFVDDEGLAFVMKRYRETHDLVHAVLDLKTDMVGEALVKWVEAMQTGLPMCIGAAILGPSRFSKDSQFEKFRLLRPWAISVGQNAKFLQNVYYEHRWEQDIDDLKYELRIDPKPSLKTKSK